jgi:hypothetical protein
MNDEYNESVMLGREYQRESRAAALLDAESTRRDVRADVLATIDELHQYLNGNVTIEAATDAAREIAYKLNSKW